MNPFANVGELLPRSFCKTKREPFEFPLNQWFVKTEAAVRSGMRFIAKWSWSRVSFSLGWIYLAFASPTRTLEAAGFALRFERDFSTGAWNVKAAEMEGIATKISLRIKGAVDQSTGRARNEGRKTCMRDQSCDKLLWTRSARKAHGNEEST